MVLGVVEKTDEKKPKREGQKKRKKKLSLSWPSSSK
jgi:hypothetical protein